MSDIFIISFANKKNILSKNLENTLKKYNYKFEIIGDGTEWVNFMTKIKSCHEYIKNSDLSEDTIIAIVDCYDLFACDGPEKLIKKFKKFNKEIVSGAENSMCLENCIPLNSYYRYHDMKPPRYQYANGGFYMGYKKDILRMLSFMLKLNNPDDQIALCKYINKYPKNVGIDTTGSLIANVTLYSYFDSYWDNKKNKIKNLTTNEYPCFVHTPGTNLDFKYRYNYFGKKILGEKYKSDKTDNVKQAIYSYVKPAIYNYKYVLLIIFFFLILIYFIFFYNWCEKNKNKNYI